MLATYVCHNSYEVLGNIRIGQRVSSARNAEVATMTAHRYAALFIFAWFAISHESDATIFAKKFKRSIINPKDVSNLHPRRLIIKCCANSNSYDDLIDHPVDSGIGVSITAEYESERNPGDGTVSPQASLIGDIRSVSVKS